MTITTDGRRRARQAVVRLVHRGLGGPEFVQAVARTVRRLRETMHLSQQELAKRIRSSQSRVAKIEAAAEGVSLDLSFRGLFAVGGNLTDLATLAGQTATDSRRQKERRHVHR